MTSHTYNIRGIEVKFPYAAYQCQLIFMEKIIESLQEVRSALPNACLWFLIPFKIFYDVTPLISFLRYIFF